MKVLLTGSKGQLGSCFQDRLPQGWEVWATDSDVLDITDLAKVKQAVAQFEPNVIVNAAAYTAVDKAESDRELAALINETGPKNLALAANDVGARLVHVSTDYVFDGTATTPYVETDATNPLGVYGKTKLDGEIAVAGVQPEAIIIRTAWVFSEYGNNFVKTMLRLANDRDTLGVVADQYGCPTYAGDIASAIISLLSANVKGGIYHYCGSDEMNWADFAERIFEYANDAKLIDKNIVVKKITTEDYKTPAARPKYSILSKSKISEQGIRSVSVSDSLRYVLNEIKNK
ncbi:dTDP-4-dehydrorhamnose reductase [Serratia ficaria]|uniref:dTDP-4-dehydrorhamnose reductase n=1 Tax=Serratia ficaria TaxID=61651 RepID=A0A240BRI4_SERFI|nr:MULTISPECIES: dTDP-4-dehydrorhamnose reductase [Serratia]MEE4483817.1 dTDP-4-dehydrorhamnose reductase [Serratia ficaria]REF45575.1 dTDP-4-dehydrorhamnose reductase [Serratia ficaria]CAI0839559.1 dTDP-4-dehydrorhamnose reductase [Serratia ficaria]CAI0871974.1 dTDP-4-dehydrorhamnose reductase [Serratia ficaria]CAI0883504.1 dTDP-4-dehydrorhamnose reductase [Serratia ficaria]